MGYAAASIALAPHHLYGWQNRFDDPERAYRTLYCATERLTCLYEVLADIRPNTAMLVEWAQLYGGAGLGDLRLAGRITWEWRRQRTLAEALVILDGEFADLDDVVVRAELEARHAPLLAEHGMQHLDISQVRSKSRNVTQTISRSLYEEGYAGLRFRSNLDDAECFALFEGRARLEATGRESEPLTRDLPELLQTVSDFELIAKRVWSP
ncbi:MAG TPA: RES family NAD+ phosphorylase [Actinomycetota bacterium]|nr:RES family NAD+ phosphorylase [Actinomycetota bacterium]